MLFHDNFMTEFHVVADCANRLFHHGFARLQPEPFKCPDTSLVTPNEHLNMRRGTRILAGQTMLELTG